MHLGCLRLAGDSTSRLDSVLTLPSGTQEGHEVKLQIRYALRHSITNPIVHTGTHGSGNCRVSSTGLLESGVSVAATTIGELGADSRAVMLASKASGEKGLKPALSLSDFLLDSKKDLQVPSVSDAEARRGPAFCIQMFDRTATDRFLRSSISLMTERFNLSNHCKRDHFSVSSIWP